MPGHTGMFPMRAQMVSYTELAYDTIGKYEKMLGESKFNLARYKYTGECGIMLMRPHPAGPGDPISGTGGSFGVAFSGRLWLVS